MIDPTVAEICRSDFLSFFRRGFEILNPTEVFEETWYHQAIAHQLYEARAGKVLRSIFNMPPRTFKSQIISVAWPAFLLGQNPTTKIMVLSYGETLARELSDLARRLMLSPFYRQVFPGTELVEQSALLLKTRQGGMRTAGSVTGSVTGRGASWLIIDDPINAMDIHSEPMRKKSKDIYSTSIATRLNDQRTDRIMVLQQRLHEDDLTGDLLAKGGWTLLKLPARATEDADIPIGLGQTHRFRIGDLLDPNRLSTSILADQEREMGAINYAAQYQQDPVPSIGNTVQRSWLIYYSPPVSRDGGTIVQSWDTAIKTEPSNDYSVCLTFLQKNNLHFLLDVWRGRVGYPELQRKAVELWHLHGAHKIIVEDQSNGTALIQDLRAGHGIPAIDWRSKDPKDVRLATASSYIQAQQLLLPQSAHWLAEFESELLGFPAKKHDDQVDALSQYFGWVRSNMGKGGFQCDWGDDYDPYNQSPHIEDLPYLLSRYR